MTLAASRGRAKLAGCVILIERKAATRRPRSARVVGMNGRGANERKSKGHAASNIRSARYNDKIDGERDIESLAAAVVFEKSVA